MYGHTHTDVHPYTKPNILNLESKYHYLRDIFDFGHPCYDVMINDIDSCQNKVSTDQYQVTISWA